MSLLAKFADIAAARSALGSADPSKVVIDEIVSPTEAIIGGRHTVLAGTNNYLGLTFDPACIAAGQRALAESGTGTTGSRMANGNYSAHRALEQEIAAFYGYPYAMVFSTGYAANLGTLAALLGPEDAVLLDADAHARIIKFGEFAAKGFAIVEFEFHDAAHVLVVLAQDLEGTAHAGAAELHLAVVRRFAEFLAHSPV